MTLRTCLRCDWEGDGRGSTCPDCGVPLYVVPAPSPEQVTPGRSDRDERGSDQPGTGGPAPSSVSPPDPIPPPTDPPRSTGRSPRAASASVLVVLVLIVTAGTWLTSREGRSVPEASTDAAVQQPPAEDSPVPVASPSPRTADVGAVGSGGGRQRLRVGGIPFSIRVPTSGWERFAERGSPLGPGTMVSINKSIAGPQGAEAIIFWSTFPDGAIARPCGFLLDRVVDPSAADLAAAVATAPGTELAVGPSDLTVGGRNAKQVELIVRERRRCDPGFFYTWRDVFGGALWPRTPPRTTIHVWIVDVDGKLLFLEAETSPQAGPDLEREISAIIRSIRFEARSDR